MMTLKNKVALITGASSGIGRASAILFARHGAKVVVAARREPELYSLVAEIEKEGGEAIACVGDVQDETFACSIVEVTMNRFERLDIAFNNAATLGATSSLDETSLNDWHNTLAVNLTSAFLAAKFQIPAMLSSPDGGSLIFTSSFVGHQIGFPNMVDYAASKAGLVGLTRALAAEYSPLGIRVNALLPGGTDTAMGKAAAPTPEARAFVEGLHAMKRLATPMEIAHSALYLASDASSFTTGSTLFADGGISIHRT